MNRKDRIELFELLTVCSQLIHHWGTGSDHEIQKWMSELSDLLMRRDERLRSEQKRAA